MKLPNWLRAIFAAEEPLPVVRPRFAEYFPEAIREPACVQCGLSSPNGDRCDRCKLTNIFEFVKDTPEEAAAKARWQKNFALTPEQLSARNKKTAATKAANKKETRA